MASSGSNSLHDLSWNTYSNEEKRQIRRAWAAVELRKEHVACDIYEMIFNQCPEARRLFPKLKFVNGKPDHKNNEFNFQALRFMQVIEASVNALDDLDALNSILDNLGRRHGKLEVNGKFRPYYWSTFLECSIHCIRKELTHCRKFANENIDEAIETWRLLLRDVMRKIKVGYNADIAHRLSQMAIGDTRRISLPTIQNITNETDFDDVL